MRYFPLLVVALSLTSISKSQAQKNFKFGKIPIADMEMTEYAPDPSAPAVVLFSTGHFRVRDYKFYRHTRIKILKQSGTDYGNFTIRVPSEGFFKASCFNLENGEVVEYKLKRSEIYEEEITDNIRVYKLFLPNVKVGSVVEIEYSHSWLPYSWRFQEMIPTVYNELNIEQSEYLVFDVSMYGHEPLKRHGTYHWLGENIPAFKPEPMVDHFSNYITKVDVELSKITIPGVYYKDYSSTWEEVNESLLESLRFGLLFRTGTPYLNSKAKELEEMDTSSYAKAINAYAYIKENIEWNGVHNVFTTADHRQNFLKNHSGNTAEINLHLIALLNKAGLSAFPVVFSTRDNGKIRKYQPTVDKLNYVICLVHTDQGDVLLDASDKDLAPGLLPAKCLNGDGWLVAEGYGRWIPLEPENITMENSFIQIDLESPDKCSAAIRKMLTVYNYLNWKKNFDKFENEEKYKKSLEDEYENLLIEDLSLKMVEDKMKVYETIKLDISSNVEDLGNSEWVLNPFILSTNLENPFRTEERKSPVDLNYATNTIRNIVIKLPEGVKAQSLPGPIMVSTEKEDATFAFTCSVMGDAINIKYQVLIKDPVISAQDYGVFKTLYSLMIDKLNESITLTKT